MSTGAPGSANSAIQLPRRSCSTTSGAKSAAAGMSVPITRTAPSGRASAIATMPMTSAGTSTGAQAAMTANSSPATAAAGQLREADTTASTSDGSRMWAITAPR